MKTRQALTHGKRPGGWGPFPDHPRQHSGHSRQGSEGRQQSSHRGQSFPRLAGLDGGKEAQADHNGQTDPYPPTPVRGVASRIVGPDHTQWRNRSNDTQGQQREGQTHREARQGRDQGGHQLKLRLEGDREPTLQKSGNQRLYHAAHDQAHRGAQGGQSQTLGEVNGRCGIDPGPETSKDGRIRQFGSHMHLKGAGDPDGTQDQGNRRHQVEKPVQVLKRSTQVLLALIDRVGLQTQSGQLGSMSGQPLLHRSGIGPTKHHPVPRQTCHSQQPRLRQPGGRQVSPRC